MVLTVPNMQCNASKDTFDADEKEALYEQLNADQGEESFDAPRLNTICFRNSYIGRSIFLTGRQTS